MIITKTPLRISFFSGGSDMPAFFNQEAGAALSVTIDKCIYIAVHKTQHIGIKTMYDEVSQVEDVGDMQHAITRETLKLVDIDKELTIASISDIIAKGSGLGSSSAFTTGLIHALASLQETADLLSPELLAQTAYNIERNLCGYPVGKQDQYAAAYGGMNLFEFNTNDTVTFTSFSGMIIINDNDNGYVYTYIMGSGSDPVLLGTTNLNPTLTDWVTFVAGTGTYVFTNKASSRDYNFVTIKTRNNA